MDTYKYGGSKNTGSIGWLLQRISAVALILLLLAHFIVIHFSGKPDVTFNVVRDRLLDPTWGPVWKTITMLLLVLALFHALNGTWGVLLDYIRKGWVRLWLFSFIVVIGLILVTLGGITVLSFRGPPPEQAAAPAGLVEEGGQ
jgi:succinate dehydrogenase hydrophobic membrane anchor protein